MTNTMKNTVEKTYSVDIRNLAETRCGIFFDEVPMVRPVTGVLSMEGDAPTITLNTDLIEVQKRVAIASILALCLEDGEAASCIMTEARSDELAKRARGLLMPEDSFNREYERLANFGKLRGSILATLFQVPLSEVLLRLQDLELGM